MPDDEGFDNDSVVETSAEATPETPTETEAARDEARSDSPPAEPSVADLVAEFRATTAAPEPEVAPVAEEAGPTAEEAVSGSEAVDGPQRELDALRAQMDEQNRQYAELEDLNYVWELALEKTAGLPMTEDFVRRFLLAEYYSDPQLKAAWDSRYAAGRDSLEACNRAVDAAIARLRESAESQYDAEATADRFAVAAAVRGASMKAPEERPPDYSKMSNAEFGQVQEKLLGFRTV